MKISENFHTRVIGYNLNCLVVNSSEIGTVKSTATLSAMKFSGSYISGTAA